MKVLYGTLNEAKLDSMRRITKELGMEVVGLKELGLPIPEVAETGTNPLENAKLKAEKYFETFSMPVFSCDSGLYFEELKEQEQPGIHVRRIGGKRLTDEEMITYYTDLARSHGGHLTGRYRNAIYFIWDLEHQFWGMDQSLETEAFRLVTKPHSKRNPGFPLDSVSVDLASGKYYYDMPDRSVDQTAIEQGFKRFFEHALAQLRVDC